MTSGALLGNLLDRSTFSWIKHHTIGPIRCGLQVNPEKFSKVNAAGAKAFVEFMIAPETQKVIGDFGKDKYGTPLFFPDAVK